MQLRRADAPETPEWFPVGGLFDYVQKVVDTARENRDNLLSSMPGFRERIVEIRFTGDQGGMNLAMGGDAIDAIVDKGITAGQRLVEELNPNKERYGHWDHHRWVRFRTLMSRLELQIQKLADAYEGGEYSNLLLKGVNDGFPYPKDEVWRRRADRRTQQLIAVLEEWRSEDAGATERASTDDTSVVLTGTTPKETADIGGEERPTVGAFAGILVSNNANELAPLQCDVFSLDDTLDFFDDDTVPKPKPELRMIAGF